MKGGTDTILSTFECSVPFTTIETLTVPLVVVVWDKSSHVYLGTRSSELKLVRGTGTSISRKVNECDTRELVGSNTDARQDGTLRSHFKFN